MESEELLGDEMPNLDICGTVFKELFEGIDVRLTSMQKPKQPPRAKILGVKLQKMSKIREKEALSS